MTMQTLWPWAAMIGGWVLAAGSVALLAWALFWDRSRGKRRCPSCWYDMTGLPMQGQERGKDVFICPECGRRIRGLRRLRRTRRHWRRAVVSLLVLLLAYGAFVAERIGRVGAMGAVPDVALIALSPWLDAKAGYPAVAPAAPMRFPGMPPIPPPAKSWKERCAQELGDRLFKRQVSAPERWLLFAWPVCRNTWISPSSGPTAGVYSDEWLDMGIDGHFVPRRLCIWLWKGALRRSITMNPDWPAEVPIAFEVEYPEWLGTGRVMARVRDRNVEVWWDRNQARPSAWVDLGVQGRLGDRVDLDMEFVPRSEWTENLPRYQWSQPLSRIRKQRLDDVVTPHSETLLAEQFAGGVMVDRTVYRHKPETLVFDTSSALAALPQDVGLGLSIDFLGDGKVLFSGALAARKSRDKRIYLISDLREWRREHPGTRFTLRIRTNPSMVMREQGYKRYWRGEVSFEVGADGRIGPSVETLPVIVQL